MNGWTGGQYSLARGVLALAFAVRLGLPTAAPLPQPLTLPLLAALALALLLTFGLFPRVTAVAATALSAATAPGWLYLFEALLLSQALVPSAPYGSWAARGRPDPGGGWRLPDGVARLWQVLFAAWLLALLYDLFAATEGAPCWLEGLVLGVFALDPRLVAPRLAAEPEVAFYDGDCGLCHRFVRLCLAEDVAGRAFRFAPLQGPTFTTCVSEEARAAVPDSFVVLRIDGDLLVRSSATAHILCGLGGHWRLLGHALFAVPRPLRDLGYDLVARVRKHVFAKPEGLCPIVPPHLGERFLP